MKTKENDQSLLNEYLKDEQLQRAMAQEELIMLVTEYICEIMEKNGITRQELAHRLGRTKGFVSQLLNGSRNLTLRTLSDIIQALGDYKIVFHLEKDDRAVALVPTLNVGSPEAVKAMG